MDFEEQVVAEAEELLIKELHMLGFQGMVPKISETNNYLTIFIAKNSYLVQLLKSGMVAHKVFEKIPQWKGCNNKIVAHKLTKKVH